MSSMKMTTAEVRDGEDTHVVLGAPPADPVQHLWRRGLHAGALSSGQDHSGSSGHEKVQSCESAIALPRDLAETEASFDRSPHL